MSEPESLPRGLCCSCRWWCPEDITIESTDEQESEARTANWAYSSGGCRRHAPRHVTQDGPRLAGRDDDNDAIAWYARWPQTWGEDYCGDWERGMCPWPRATE